MMGPSQAGDPARARQAAPGSPSGSLQGRRGGGSRSVCGRIRLRCLGVTGGGGGGNPFGVEPSRPFPPVVHWPHVGPGEAPGAEAGGVCPPCEPTDGGRPPSGRSARPIHPAPGARPKAVA